ncbi:MAG TPA: sodium:proton antiporter [Polyangiales bacterium]|nr:sodium:proton antiporter [Polyangiales bacterium]
MSNFEIGSAVLCLAAAGGFLNTRIFRLPSAIGLMAISLFGSLVIVALGAAGWIDRSAIHALVAQIDFADVLMHNLLGLLLFAGALHVDITDLASNRLPIAALALGGTLISTVIVGLGTYFLMASLGLELSLAHAFLFGALISPTDPIAVLGILKSANAPEELSIQISGESLFNDGVGVVLFVGISAVAGGAAVSAGEFAILFAREALGGAMFGLGLGYLGFLLLRQIDDYSVEVLITLSMVLGGYAVAERLHLSAPIAAVVAGLVVGNQGRRVAMSDRTRQHVDMFWELLDEMLNAVLFLLLGLEATSLQLTPAIALAAALSIPLVLAARFTSVGITISGLLLRRSFPRNAVTLLTWSGLRGGISVALALSIPAGPVREALLVMTYAVVASSILVQGLSLRPALRWLGAVAPARP